MNEIARIETEYFNVAISDELLNYLEQYRQQDPILSTMNDRKLILYVVHKAIDQNIEICTDKLNLQRNRDVKLKKTRLISRHFEGVNNKYQSFGVNISSRQYFHRLILNYLREVFV
ncbi:hypothetical protein CSW98_13125 [Vibrio sp. HA2012]|uniref:hypothetical protein n=1 Tax=Vibrio sp. HA2012 TaxID=1971595 RepID=UPI000C2CC5BC|nr:hypothetical protein [Vibrio sp. HA2012]PJC85970.1 hypothetical protein CSW98_13125 [Vibrio sp. HA2012]